MFIAREGICAEDALVHVSQILNSVQAFAHDSAEYLTANDQAMVLGIAQQAEMAKALVDAVLAGVTRSGTRG